MRAWSPLPCAAELQALLCHRLSPLHCRPHLLGLYDVHVGSGGIHKAAPAQGTPPGGGAEREGLRYDGRGLDVVGGSEAEGRAER